ncbi:hypothetical protein TNCV_2091601 [Trichonephila clavipes]|nr:hypothetical protein TNCV_2091601 [Trichonephila clavipes]
MIKYVTTETQSDKRIVPSAEKTETHQFLPILERCHPLESFNYKCPIRRKKRKHINYLQSLNDAIHWSPSTINVPSEKKRKHINSLQSLNDALHWSPSTIRELGHPVNPIGGEQ